jgi:hypothetical protein
MQYGIRLAKEDLDLPEFLRLLSGIMPDTPLGRLVMVRAEKSPEVLKGLSSHERQIRADWATFNRGLGDGGIGQFGDIEMLTNALARAFGG